MQHREYQAPCHANHPIPTSLFRSREEKCSPFRFIYMKNVPNIHEARQRDLDNDDV